MVFISFAKLFLVYSAPVRDKLINVMYENGQLKAENSKLRAALNKAYDFMKQFYTVWDLIKILQIKKSKAYKIIRQLNAEVEARGYFVVAGKISK